MTTGDSKFVLFCFCFREERKTMFCKQQGVHSPSDRERVKDKTDIGSVVRKSQVSVEKNIRREMEKKNIGNFADGWL